MKTRNYCTASSEKHVNDYCTATLVILLCSPGGCSAGIIPQRILTAAVYERFTSYMHGLNIAEDYTLSCLANPTIVYISSHSLLGWYCRQLRVPRIICFSSRANSGLHQTYSLHDLDFHACEHSCKAKTQCTCMHFHEDISACAYVQ